MRVISQDGTMDVPYEISIFNTDGIFILAKTGFPNGNPRGRIMAKYETPENAIKAFNSLGYFYAKCCSDHTVFQFPKDEEIEEFLKNA